MHPGDLVLGRFEIERLAGSGGMASVFLARDRASGERVAVKSLAGHGEREAARFAREARLLAALDHPAIVRHVADGISAAGEPFLVMEWLEGEDLAARLAREGLTPGESVALASRVAQALAVAHARGVLHRDIKPSNLFLVDRDIHKVKILDFGVAKSVRTSAALTVSGAMIGTPGYMAPEQARGSDTIDARADVFSLGCVLFECLTGRPAFLGEHVMALLAKILLEEAPRVSELVSELPAALDDLVARMLDKDRAGRPADATRVLAELSRLDLADAPRAVPSRPPASLTVGEQRLVCVVLAAPPPGPAAAPGGPVAVAPTLEVAPPSDAQERLREAVSRHGGRLEVLVDGSLVVTLGRAGRSPQAATDQAVQAARCALALRALVPDRPMALAMGRGMVTGRFPVGEVIDRAAHLLDAPAALGRGTLGGFRLGVLPVRVDEVTAGLLDARFDIGGDASGLDLRGERVEVGAARKVLGKVTPCVGRERELGVLTGVFDECVSEPVARAVVVTAPPGYGKSRLRQEMLDRIGAKGGAVSIWSGRGDAVGAGSPFALIAGALRREAGIREGEPLHVRRQKLSARVQRHVPAGEAERVAAFLGELVGAPFPDEHDVQLRAARADPMLLGDQIRRAFEELCAAETEAQPLLLVLDDLQWGDAPSVHLVDAVLRNLRDRPVMVVALARPEVEDLFPSLWGERASQEIRLRELSKKTSEKLVREVLGPGVPDATVARVVERAGGNAFFLEELMRAVAAGRAEEMPRTVLAVVESRLDGLEPEARRVLRAASIFGEVFWEAGVLALTGGAQRTTELRDWIAELCEREILAPHGAGKFPGQRELTFQHGLVRDAAYGMLTDADRALGHRLAGEWLEAAGEVDAVLLAEHFERGNAPARALACWRRAAEQALAGNDFPAAIDRAERAIALGAEGETLGSLRRIQAEAHSWPGDHSTAVARAKQALRELPRGGPAWCRAAGDLTVGAAKLLLRADLANLYEQAKAIDPIPEALAAWARLASALFVVGRREDADTLLDLVDRHDALGAGDPVAMAHVQHARSWQAHYRGSPARSLRFEEQSVMSFTAAGHQREVAYHSVGLGFAFMEVGAFERAEEVLREAIAVAERLMLKHVLCTARHNLGLVLAHRGAVQEGLALEEAALAGLTALGDVRIAGAAAAYLARIAMFAGDPEAAERHARAGLAVTELPEPRAHLLGMLAAALLAAGRPPEALEPAREAAAILERLGRISDGESVVRLAHAEALAATGDHAGARAVIAAARSSVLGYADRIDEPALRQSFLELPDNAQILAHARAWLGA